MSLNFSGAYLLGYSQTNNFFGDSLFRRGSTASMTISAIIDVRPTQVYPDSPVANVDELGAKEAFDFLNSQAGNIGDWQDINIDYGNGVTTVATGRIASLESIRPNPVRIGEFSVDIEIPTSGSEDAWNMTGPTHQDSFVNEFPGTSVGNIFQNSGAVFQDFSEEFSFNLGEDNSYEYEHSLNMQILSGDHLSKDPIQTAKDVAQAIFYTAASDVPAFGFVDENFSGFYGETMESTMTAVDKSGVKYFSESYDLENFNCSFSKRVKLDYDLKENYSVDINHSLTMDEAGYVNVSENGQIKSTANKEFSDRYTDVRNALETEIANAKDRCEAIYDSYNNQGFIDPDYKGNNQSNSSDYETEANLFEKPISVGRTFQPTVAGASYSVAFTNNKHTYEADGIHEFTQNVSEGRDGIVNVSLNGTFTKYYPNKFDGYNWKTQVYDQLKSSFDTKAQQTYSYYKTKQLRSYQERVKTVLPVTSYQGTLAAPSLALVSSSVTLPKYGPSVEYSNEYTDDPSILKAGSPLYDTHNFRKFSVSTNDKMMKPINNAYVIAGKEYQIIHDATQTEMGNRSFTIEGFIKRPTTNTITNPTAWNLGPKLNAVKNEISQIMANIIADAKLKPGGNNKSFIGDMFIQDISFSIDSRGNFSASGNIPFIALGGEKYNTVGRIM